MSPGGVTKEFLEESPYFITKTKCSDERFVPQIKFIENLDEIPMFDYDEIVQRYGDITTFYPKRFGFPGALKTVTFFTTRGCPFNCIFCASGSVHGHRVRAYSIERVKQEIDYLIDIMNVSLVSLYDDHFLYDVKRAIEIIDYIGSKKVYMEFTGSLALYAINKQLVDAFVRNNVKFVQLALESGCERVLKEIIQKPLNLDIARKTFALFDNTDIFVMANIVIGFPEETEEDVEQTIEFLQSVNVHWIQCFSPSPISGSRLLKNALEKGYLEKYDMSKSIFEDNIFSHTLIPAEKLAQIRYDLNLRVNFVNNYHIRNGRFGEIVDKFVGIYKKYNDHAFAFYCAYQCFKGMNPSEEISKQMDFTREQYNSIIETNSFWRFKAQQFGLPEKL